MTPWKAFIHLWREASAAPDHVEPGVGSHHLQPGFRLHVPREANVQQLLDIAEKAGIEIGEMGDASRMRKLGRALSRIEGRVIGSVRIKSRMLNGRKLYRIE